MPLLVENLLFSTANDEMIALFYTYSTTQIADTGTGWIWVGCTDQDVEGTFECEDGTQVNSGKLQRVYRRLSLIRSFMGR